MKRKLRHTISTTCILLIGWGMFTPANAATTEPDSSPADKGLEKIDTSNSSTAAPAPAGEELVLSSALQKLHIAGGISAGEFYGSNSGTESNNQTLLSNFLFELSSGENAHPLSFKAAVGESATPSLLSSPGTTPDIDLEYASLSLKALPNSTFEVGLLKPDAGFEDTYTYNNNQIVLGALAAQQPYNASGIKVMYEANNLKLNGAYYGKRLDESEYAVNDAPADHAWEAGITTTINAVACRLYHYEIAGSRHLTGAVVESDSNNIHFALNVDRWEWNKAVADQHERRSSLGAAFYVVPSFDKFSLPMRLEYIDQGGSGLYLDNPETKKIYAATISPTYRYSKSSYLRFEASFVQADKGFTNKDGETKDNRIYLATELGYLF